LRVSNGSTVTNGNLERSDLRNANRIVGQEKYNDFPLRMNSIQTRGP
jgi:hypothetical protein